MSARRRNHPVSGRVRPVAWGVALLLAAVVPLLIAAGGSGERTDTDERPGPRELYNEGTRLLREGKLNEAEATLQNAVAVQNPAVQPPALYNLGEVRFQQGKQEYTNAPDSRKVKAASARASLDAGEAIKTAEAALAGEDVQAILAAYLRGRGARKELRLALQDVQLAMDTYGATLSKWRRASGDFKSTVELRPGDRDAQTNADLVDGEILKLVDLMDMMMRGDAEMKQKRDELGKKMDQLNEKKPDQSQPPPKPGQQGKQDEGGDNQPANQPAPGQGGQEDSPMPGRSEMESARKQLGELLKQLLQKLPPELQEQLKQSGSGDEDEDEGEGNKPQPNELKEGQEQGPAKQGTQMLLTREEAVRLLQMLRDPNRKLSLGGMGGFKEEAQPQARKGRDW